jgi:multiple sugar transport system permease protein
LPKRSDADRLVFLSPWVLTFLLFALFPLLFSLALSFLRYSPLDPSATRWVGLAQYRRLFADPDFWRALGNTLYFVVATIPATTILALLLALALDHAPLRNFLRATFFLPSIVSLAVVAVLFKQLYAPHGFVNGLLGGAGLPQPSWLLEPKLALPSIMAMDVWAAVGYYMLLLLAGLQTVPRVLHEAVALDGGGRWARFRHVTFPHLRPVLLFVVALNTIRSLQVFVEVFVMTGGGPLGSTRTVVYQIYDTAFHHLDLGYASAIAYVLFVVIAAVTLLEARGFRMGKAAAE